jgi:hypothetical protein
MIIPTHPGRGRGSHRSLEEATALVCQWQASGLSKQAWCNAQGILPTALRSCLHRTKRQLIALPRAHHPFIELQRRPPPSAAPRLVRLVLARSVATAELTVEDLGTLIEHLSAGRP